MTSIAGRPDPAALLQAALDRVGFDARYLAFTQLGRAATMIEPLDRGLCMARLATLGPAPRYFAREKFFRLVVEDRGRVFWIHLEVAGGLRVHLYQMTPAGKHLAGSPWTALFRRRGGDVARLGPLRFDSYDELERLARAGYELVTDIIAAYPDP